MSVNGSPLQGRGLEDFLPEDHTNQGRGGFLDVPILIDDIFEVMI